MNTSKCKPECEKGHGPMLKAKNAKGVDYWRCTYRVRKNCRYEEAFNEGSSIKMDTDLKSNFPEFMRNKSYVQKPLKRGKLEEVVGWEVQRERALKKWGNRCNKCGDTSKLHVHHLSYDEERKGTAYELQDLISLCKKCHAIFHANHKYDSVRGYHIGKDEMRLLVRDSDSIQVAEKEIKERGYNFLPDSERPFRPSPIEYEDPDAMEKGAKLLAEFGR